MANITFKIPKSTKKFKTSTGLDVAARYLVYKLDEATDGRPKEQRLLSALGEIDEVVLRSVERGWVTLDDVGGKQRSAALTEEGRRLARRGR